MEEKEDHRSKRFGVHRSITVAARIQIDFWEQEPIRAATVIERRTKKKRALLLGEKGFERPLS